MVDWLLPLEGSAGPPTIAETARLGAALRILAAAAAAHYRRHHASRGGRKTDLAAPAAAPAALWVHLAARLRAVGRPAAGAARGTHAAAVFGLGWLVQHFVPDPSLRQWFVDAALRDGQGLSLLALPSPTPGAPAGAAVVLGAVAASVLLSASAETVSEAFHMLLRPQQSADGRAPAGGAASSALCRVAVGVAVGSGPTGGGLGRPLRLPRVSAFVDLLRLSLLSVPSATAAADIAAAWAAAAESGDGAGPQRRWLPSSGCCLRNAHCS